MKKLLAIAAVVILLGYVKYLTAGDLVSAPAGELSNPINADYGGVEIATNSFYIGLATVPSGIGSQGADYGDFYASTTTRNNVYARTKWRVYGVEFSTGLCSNSDFVSVQVSSAGAAQSREIARFYNSVNVSTSANGDRCSGVYTARWPIRAYGNLFYGVNFPANLTGSAVNPLNNANLLYWKEPETRN